MERYHLVRLPSLLLLCLTLNSCGGGGSSAAPETVAPAAEEPQTPVEPDPPVQPDPLPPKSSGLLVLAASDEALASTLREGMNSNQALFIGDPTDAIDFSPSPPSSESQTPAQLPEFSTTNLQEAGVDEADSAKYDGEILYVADFVRVANAQASGGIQASSHGSVEFQPVINMLRTDAETAGTVDVGRITLDPGESRYELYVRSSPEGKQLVGLTENYSYPAGAFVDYGYWQAQATRVRGWLVDDPEAPVDQFSLDIEGALLTSRRIGNLLYVVTRYSPVIEDLIRYPRTEDDFVANEVVLNNIAAPDLLPQHSLNGMPSQPLVSSERCYLPNDDYEGPETLTSSGSFLTITAINLDAPDSIKSMCLNGYASDFYLSLTSLYITSNAGYDRTLIHKIALNAGDPLYRGSGSIPGYIGTSSPSFLMSEEGADLRVFSTLWRQRNFGFPVMPVPEPEAEAEAEEVFYGDHQFTVLREHPTIDQLDIVARLPNDEQQNHIGKPGESIFAARILGDRAYVVTFRTIDPLYVLDLSDPVDPKLAGELEIPGFSTLLQPLGDNLLLGIGSEVSVERPLVQGVKVALFDVSNAEQPIELSSEVVGRRGTNSPALYDHRALTLLQTMEGYRLALPIERHGIAGGGGLPSLYFPWSESSLYQFEVDSNAGSLSRVGKIVAAQASDEISFPNIRLTSARAFLNGEAVFLSVPGSEEILTGMWGHTGE